MSSPVSSRVLILGGGPVGLAASLELARFAPATATELEDALRQILAR